jgi:hypothetical protein
VDKPQTLREAVNNGKKQAPGQVVQQRIGGRDFSGRVQLRVTLGPVNTSMVVALLPQIRPGKARGVKFGGSK